jgi:hypothetical protein
VKPRPTLGMLLSQLIAPEFDERSRRYKPKRRTASSFVGLVIASLLLTGATTGDSPPRPAKVLGDAVSFPAASVVRRSSASIQATRRAGATPAAEAVAARTNALAKARGRAGAVLNVRDFGALGDGAWNDTTAIQRAMDAVARAGGGVAYVPAGTYRTTGLRQPSFVHIVGAPGSKLMYPNNSYPQPIVRSSVDRTTGTIAAGSTVLKVADTSKFVVDGLVAVRGAGGASSVQVSALGLSVTPTLGSFRIQKPQGFPTGKAYSTNYMLVDKEIISYSSMVAGTLQTVKRGLFGTIAAAHKAGAPIAQLNVLYARVVSIGTGQVTLDTPAVFGVRDTTVFIGSVHLGVSGLTIDGSQQADPNQFPILYELANHATISDNAITKGKVGAIRLDMGTRNSVIENNVLTDNGDPSHMVGASVWLFRSAVGDIVRGNTMKGWSYAGIYIDDRTGESSEFDGPGRNNLIELNDVDIHRQHANAAVGIIGSSNNEVRLNTFANVSYGVEIVTANQGTRPPAASSNYIHDNTLSKHHYAFWVSGSNNQFLNNQVTQCDHIAHNVGTGNTFSG